ELLIELPPVHDPGLTSRYAESGLPEWMQEKHAAGKKRKKKKERGAARRKKRMAQFGPSQALAAGEAGSAVAAQAGTATRRRLGIPEWLQPAAQSNKGGWFKSLFSRPELLAAAATVFFTLMMFVPSPLKKVAPEMDNSGAIEYSRADLNSDQYLMG